MMTKVGKLMRANKFIIMGITVLLMTLFFVQAGMIANNAEALPDNPSLKITVKGDKNIEYFDATTLTFKVEVEWLFALPATSATAYIAMKYDFAEFPESDPHFVNASVDLTFTNQKAEETFTINFFEPLDLPLGNVYVIQFVVREYNATGDIQDTDTVNVEAGKYYDFSIVGKPEIGGRDGAELMEGELIDISVDVLNTGNAAYPVLVIAYADDKEIDRNEVTVYINDTTTVLVPWANPEEGEYSITVTIQAKTGFTGGDDSYSAVLAESDSQNVKIKPNSEIPWPYWVIFGIAVVIILVIIAVIIKTNRKKPEEDDEEEEEDDRKRGRN